jgi:hypothetical protein
MSIFNNIYYPKLQWSNPFNDDNDFEIHLGNHTDSLDISKIIKNEKNYILYNRYVDIKNFFNKKNTDELKNKLKNNLIKIIFIGNDSYPINKDDIEYIINNDWLFKNKNVQLWQTNYYNNEISIEQKLYVGVYIHHMLKEILTIEYQHTKNDFIHHFLTLNNKDKPSRSLLFNLWQSFSTDDKNKLLASFNFKSIFLEEKLFKCQSNIEMPLLYSNNLLNFYKTSLFEIVCETGEFNVTEKTYKPLILGVPFILYNINTINQLNYFKSIGIDINYFNIDYTDIKNVNVFILEILKYDIFTLKEKYNHVFIKAENNKKKIYEYFNIVKNQIINL